MNREKELEQALKQLINQSEEAVFEGTMITKEFRDKLEHAKKNLSKEKYVDGKPEENLYQQNSTGIVIR